MSGADTFTAHSIEADIASRAVEDGAKPTDLNLALPKLEYPHPSLLKTVLGESAVIAHLAAINQ